MWYICHYGPITLIRPPRLIRRILFGPIVDRIDHFHKWRAIYYSFVCILIRPNGLI